ncbi:MAG TPA: AAA family ATPase [Acidisarcina sp.]
MTGPGLLETCRTEVSWTEANQALLAAEFARLRSLLTGDTSSSSDFALERAKAAPGPSHSAIDQLVEIFGLTLFERDLLLLCAGTEMDSLLASECARVQGQSGPPSVTFGLGMAVLSEPHWSALTPARPLRRFNLLLMDGARGLSSASLRIDERVLHFIAGTNLLDPALDGLVQSASQPVHLAEAHQRVAELATSLLSSEVIEPATINLCGNDPDGQQDVAWTIANALDRSLLVVRIEDLPVPGAELDSLLPLLEREMLLLPALVMLQCSAHGLTPPARRLAERLSEPLILASADAVRIERTLTRFDVDKPEPAEQQRLWDAALGAPNNQVDEPGWPHLSSSDETPARNLAPASTEGQERRDAIRRVSEQFRLSTQSIFATSMLVQAEGVAFKPEKLWEACRSVSRPRLEHLAQRITPAAVWEDLVLPQAQTRTLRQMASQVRHRMRVYEDWGFSSRGRRGLGVSALLAGESGTGKTLAAEVLAAELQLDLYRIDLSSVVSKYIGESEKNLRQVFDAAEDGGVMLLFDEADALFGKRAEVKDSHDRYSNIEVSYLLQRMEAYSGLAVLTTNLKTSLDRAFQRRLRFVINFPFPDAAQREAIWRHIFPGQTPTESLDYARLAQLNVAGGNIRNVALTAAFLAAESGSAVRMTHLLEAAQIEAQKIERPLSPAETRGWV